MNNPRIPERREFLSGVAALSLLGLAGCGGGGGGNTAVGGSLPPTGVASVGTLRLPPHFPATQFPRRPVFITWALARNPVLCYTTRNGLRH